MPKPNRLLVGDVWYVLDPDYLGGARAARSGRATGRGTPARRAGERNEIALEHVRFGQDVLALPPAGRDVGEDPGLPRGPAPERRLLPDAALLAYMEATRSLREAALTCHDSAWLPDSWRFADPSELARIRADGAAYMLMRPGRLREALAARGVPVNLDMAKALLRRLRYEHETRCEPLGFLEECRLADAPSEVHLLLGALAARQARTWTACPGFDRIDVDARRGRGWAQDLAGCMEAEGLGFLLVRVGAAGLRLSGKGCTAVAVRVQAEEAQARRRHGFAQAMA